MNLDNVGKKIFSSEQFMQTATVIKQQTQNKIHQLNDLLAPYVNQPMRVFYDFSSTSYQNKFLFSGDFLYKFPQTKAKELELAYEKRENMFFLRVMLQYGPKKAVDLLKQGNVEDKFTAIEIDHRFIELIKDKSLVADLLNDNNGQTGIDLINKMHVDDFLIFGENYVPLDKINRNVFEAYKNKINNIILQRAF